MTGVLIKSVRDGVALLTLNRPAKLNALDDALPGALTVTAFLEKRRPAFRGG